MFLLDTNIVAEVRKPAGDPNVKAWIETVDSMQLYISVLVVGEIRQGIDRLARRDAMQAEVYETWLHRLYRDHHDRIIPLSAPIAEAWGRLNVPDPLPVVDGLMAATAKVRGFTLVTRDTATLARTGVRLLDPFEPR